MSENTSDVIVIGGGVAGLSTAMQLARRGVSVTVLEREQIGNGSTGRAAGLLGQLRGTAEHTRMLMDGVKIVQELEERAGVEIYVQTGSVRVAETAEREQEIADLVVCSCLSMPKKEVGWERLYCPRLQQLLKVFPPMED